MLNKESDAHMEAFYRRQGALEILGAMLTTKFTSDEIVRPLDEVGTYTGPTNELEEGEMYDTGIIIEDTSARRR